MDDAPPEPPSPDELMRTARDDLPFFYANATPAETWAMDGLLMHHAALVMLMNAPRGLPTDSELERQTREREQSFMESRDRVRGSRAYTGLTVGQQIMIERLLCNVKVPDVGA